MRKDIILQPSWSPPIQHLLWWIAGPAASLMAFTEKVMISEMSWCVDNFFFSLKEEQLFYDNILVYASQNSEAHQKNLINMLMMWTSEESACFREEESSCEVK